MTYPLLVAPAKAGVQGQTTQQLPWIPASAGMTKKKLLVI
jgi:hypothetical protein